MWLFSEFFSITIGIVLSFRPVKRNGIIALLAAGFAIFSIIPPADAFTVSRNSQIMRLENMLETAGVLADGEIKPKPDADMTLRMKTTSILDYLERAAIFKEVPWMPKEFKGNTIWKRYLALIRLIPKRREMENTSLQIWIWGSP